MHSITNDIKCVVWDLDNTLWDGILLEDVEVTLKNKVFDTIVELDRRGILNSIASKNDFDSAMEKLRYFNIQDYFLYPQISWNSKSHSISKIKEALNIGIDSILFVDDQRFEIDEVRSEYPIVNYFDATQNIDFLENEHLSPKFSSYETSQRRALYQAESNRKDAESEFVGTSDEFLEQLDLKFTIKPAMEGDLLRIVELTTRTNQLNATGRIYNLENIRSLLEDPEYEILVSSLEDRYGSYGIIGLCIIKTTAKSKTIEMILLSCRVMSRGVGKVLLTYLVNQCFREKRDLYVNFIDTGKNKLMLITLKFMGFKRVETDEDEHVSLYKHPLDKILAQPNFIEINVLDDMNTPLVI